MIQVVSEPNNTLVPLDSFLSALFIKIEEGFSFFVCVVHHTCSAQLCRFCYVKTCSPGFRVFIAQGKLETIPNIMHAEWSDFLNDQISWMVSMDNVPKLSRNLNAFFWIMPAKGNIWMAMDSWKFCCPLNRQRRGSSRNRG